MKPRIKQQVIVVDVFADIVAKVQEGYRIYKNDEDLTITYMYGPVEEIEANLIEIAKSIGLPEYEGPKKYPLIAVFQDFPENISTGGYHKKVTLPVILIATGSAKDWKAEKRYTQSFKTTLYPIYDLLLQGIADNTQVIGNDPSLFAHTKYDRLYYGKRKLGTGVSDYVDAIELQNLNLTVKRSCKAPV